MLYKKYTEFISFLRICRLFKSDKYCESQWTCCFVFIISFFTCYFLFSHD